MTVRLKSGQFVTLSPEVILESIGRETPDKVERWKKELAEEGMQALRAKEALKNSSEAARKAVEDKDKHDEIILKQLREERKGRDAAQAERSKGFVAELFGNVKNFVTGGSNGSNVS